MLSNFEGAIQAANEFNFYW